MKRKISVTLFVSVYTVFSLCAQDIIAGWTFPTGTTADAHPDQGNVNNSARLVTAEGGTSTIDFSKNGFTSKSAQATGWDNGADTKYWQIEINTTGYDNLKLYSKQTAGGANPGPRDWKVQYKVGATGIWTDIAGTTLVNANDWTSAVLDNVSIPTECQNQPSVYIRWIMTTNTSITPPDLVLASGTTKIDDIFIWGYLISTDIDENEKFSVNIYPNPTCGILHIDSEINQMNIEIYNSTGHLIKKYLNQNRNSVLDLSSVCKGLYFIKIFDNNSNKLNTSKILIQ